MRNTLDTDRKILRTIFEMYVLDYPAKGDPWLPIDVQAIASRLNCNPELLFGRLYYDMANRLRIRDPKDPNTIRASIFEMTVGDKRHCVNFPYMTAILASQEAEQRRNLWTLWIAVLALVVSVASLAVQLAGAK